MEKNIQNITVRELTDKADVNRSTFYANFKDIYDLYNQVEDVVIQEVSDILSIKENRDAKTFFNILFQYIADNKQACQLILAGNVNSTFTKRISALFKFSCIEHWKNEYDLTYTEKELEYYAQFLFSGNLAVIGEWVAHEHKQPTEEVMTILTDIDYNFENFIKSKAKKATG